MKEVAWAISRIHSYSQPRANLTHCSVGVVETSSNEKSYGRRLRVQSGAKSNDASERKSLCILIPIPKARNCYWHRSTATPGMKALPLGQLLPMPNMPNKVTARERGQRKNSCQPFDFLIECLLKKFSLFAHWGLTCGSCWKKLRILYRSESCSKVFSLWGLPLPKRKSRVTLCKIKKKHISNIKYETGLRSVDRVQLDLTRFRAQLKTSRSPPIFEVES